jgi:ferrous iron transport protein B
MATRTIDDEKDRLTTILIAPLMTCSARLPVYAMIIGAFIPDRHAARRRPAGAGAVGPYVVGIVGAMVVALLLRRTVTKGASSGFIMEMPKYQWPHAAICCWACGARADLPARAGTIILTTVILWLLLSFPKPPEGGHLAVDYSIAGRIANGSGGGPPDRLQPRHRAGAVPSMAAREVAVAAIAPSMPSMIPSMRAGRRR